VRLVPRLYNEEQLRLRGSPQTAVGTGEFVVRELAASKAVNVETEEATVLETVTRRQPVNIAD
jgi:hypothetical protein